MSDMRELKLPDECLDTISLPRDSREATSLPDASDRDDDVVERRRDSSGQVFMAGTGQASGGGESPRRDGTDEIMADGNHSGRAGLS